VEGLLGGEFSADFDRLVAEAVRANVKFSVKQVRKGSEILEKLIQEDGLMIVGAEYSLETGVVHFFFED